jgi:predicted RNA-binding Zn-ribbon protein involved in translation (DUF1610 family)
MGNNRDTIACTSCSRNIVPRLWHVTNFRVTRTQHICPFCGRVLYITGPSRAVFFVLGALNAFFRIISFVGDMAGGRRRRRF